MRGGPLAIGGAGPTRNGPMNPSSNDLTCAGREIHDLEWSTGNAETVIAGLRFARTCRDMDDLASVASP